MKNAYMNEMASDSETQRWWKQTEQVRTPRYGVTARIPGGIAQRGAVAPLAMRAVAATTKEVSFLP